MKLKNLITRFFILTSLFIIGGGSSATYYRTANAAVRKKEPNDIANLWFILVFTATTILTLIRKAIKWAIAEVVSHILQIIALIISSMIAGSYYKLHGTNNETTWWQRLKQRVRRQRAENQ